MWFRYQCIAAAQITYISCIHEIEVCDSCCLKNLCMHKLIPSIGKDCNLRSICNRVPDIDCCISDETVDANAVTETLNEIRSGLSANAGVRNDDWSAAKVHNFWRSRRRRYP